MKKQKLKFNTTAIILAGGTGKRMNSNISKQLLKIRDEHIIEITLQKFQNNDNINEIIVVSNERDLQFLKLNICSNYSKIKKVVLGGNERQHSVYNALKCLDDNTDYVLIHDGVRPFIYTYNINNIIDETVIHKATVLGVPTKNTIKIIDENGYIKETLNRNTLYEIHTPQCFEKKLIVEAYEKLLNSNIQVTDDASVIEKFSNIKVKLVIDSYDNIKITTKEDLDFANIILNKGVF